MLCFSLINGDTLVEKTHKNTCLRGVSVAIGRDDTNIINKFCSFVDDAKC